MTKQEPISNWEIELEKRAEKAGVAFSQLVKVIAKLRHPEKGCPWDLQQTHQSLRQFMLEEAYESVQAMSEQNSDELQGELGDVLLQVVLNAQLMSDARTGDIVGIIDSLIDKMIRRHPHVFEKWDEKSVGDHKQRVSIEDLHIQWAAIKAQEKKLKQNNELRKASVKLDAIESVFEPMRNFGGPANSHAYKIGKIAEKIGFDWGSISDVLCQVESEVEELKQEIPQSTTQRNFSVLSMKDKASVYEELGDVYFSLAQLSRHLGVDPEVVAAAGNQKFLKRFALVEELMQEKGWSSTHMDSNSWESLWTEAKKKQRER